jgi:hypothetical protein
MKGRREKLPLKNISSCTPGGVYLMPVMYED